MVPDARVWRSAIKEDGVRVIDLNLEGRRLEKKKGKPGSVFACITWWNKREIAAYWSVLELQIIEAAVKALPVDANVFVRDARITKVGADNGMSARVELPF